MPKSYGITTQRASVHIEAKLKQMGLEIPPPVQPAANYVGAVRSGNTIFLSGHIPYQVPHFYKPQHLITGKVGVDLTTEQAYEAAKSIGLALVGTLKHVAGDLDKVRIIKLFGIVNCIDGFKEAPKVINGASDFIVQVFGEKGKHARSAIGTNALPLGVPVEIEMIAFIEE